MSSTSAAFFRATPSARPEAIPPASPPPSNRPGTMLRALHLGKPDSPDAPERPASARPLKVLHRAFMLLRRRPRSKRTQILPLPRLRILLARIQTILSGL